MLSVMLGSMLAHWTAVRLALAAGTSYTGTRQVLLGSTFGLQGTWGLLGFTLMVVVKIVIGEQAWAWYWADHRADSFTQAWRSSLSGG